MNYIKSDMPHIRALFHFLDWVAFSFWGLTFVSITNLFQENIIDFSQVEGTPFQYIYILVGIGYFILNGYNTYQSKKLEREHKKLENDKLREELDMLEHENEKKNNVD